MHQDLFKTFYSVKFTAISQIGYYYLLQIYNRGNWGWGKLDVCLKWPWLLSGRARIWTLTIQLQKLHCLPLYSTVSHMCAMQHPEFVGSISPFCFVSGIEPGFDKETLVGGHHHPLYWPTLSGTRSLIHSYPCILFLSRMTPWESSHWDRNVI